ncbi:hypothetical protein RCL1_007027 [Eukaryota sp. TZLM3-RCL]
MQSDFEALEAKTKALLAQWTTRIGTRNHQANRFTDVIAHDFGLVQLSSGTYINASFCCDKTYIATQSPIPYSYNDFWQMAYETHSLVIVALCNRLTDQYWPYDNSNGVYGKFQVHHVGTEKVSDDLIIRTFNVFVLPESRKSPFFNSYKELPVSELPQETLKTVKHYHFLGWPDARTPSNIVDFEKMVELLSHYEGRMIVHCTAGVGRSGTLISILEMIKLKKKGKLEQFDLNEFVLSLRQARSPMMVETIDQYSFVKNYRDKLLSS